MTSVKPTALQAAPCLATPGECHSTAAGHDLPVMQERVAAATPSKWQDAIVEHAGADGWIALNVLDSGQTVWVWNHADLSTWLTAGEPVALHGLYHALARGEQRFNVLQAAPST